MRHGMLAFLAVSSVSVVAMAGPYAPAAGQTGSTAIANTDPSIVAWASSFADLVRGPLDIADPGAGLASYGTGNEALGFADGNAANVVSLGDGGRITLAFAHPIFDGPGFDLAVFENGFSDTFLELAFVEVSSNGTDFARFPAVSLTQSSQQVASFGALDPTDINDLAGKYRAGFGTPFDLAELAGASPSLDIDNINFVRIVDVVGSIDPAYGTFDSLGNPVNDPYPTAFASGGFDLDGVAAIHLVPEPTTAILAILAAMLLGCCRVGRRDR